MLPINNRQGFDIQVRTTWLQQAVAFAQQMQTQSQTLANDVQNMGVANLLNKSSTPDPERVTKERGTEYTMFFRYMM